MRNPRSFRIDNKVLAQLKEIGRKEDRTVTWLLEKAARLLIAGYKKAGHDALQEGK
jgi:predicted transcriptional regulator